MFFPIQSTPILSRLVPGYSPISVMSLKPELSHDFEICEEFFFWMPKNKHLKKKHEISCWLQFFCFSFFGHFDPPKISCHFQEKCRFFIQKMNKQDSWFFRFWSLWPKNGMNRTYTTVFNIYFFYNYREQLAIADFAKSLLVIPKTLSVNAAQDSSDLVAKLRWANWLIITIN